MALAAMLLAAGCGNPPAAMTPSPSPSLAAALSPTPVLPSPEPSVAPTASPVPATPPPAAQAGAITGALGYPSEFLPGLGVYAIAVDGSRFVKVESASFQLRYTMLGVAAGDYYVYAVARWSVATPQERFGAAYTKAVPCGLSVKCTDHTPIKVHVDAAKTTSGINPGDWYAGPDDFPLIPDGPLPVDVVRPASFSTAEEAAVSYAEHMLVARRVPTESACQQNNACFWFASHRSGHEAVYFAGAAGSNRDLVHCGIYVVGDKQGWWRPLDFRCGRVEPVFPAVGAAGQVQMPIGQTGCVRVRTAPGLTAPIVQCLPEGTAVTIDGGPYYAPTQASTGANGPSVVDLWWHVAGGGWMSHEYLHAVNALI